MRQRDSPAYVGQWKTVMAGKHLCGSGKPYGTGGSGHDMHASGHVTLSKSTLRMSDQPFFSLALLGRWVEILRWVLWDWI